MRLYQIAAGGHRTEKQGSKISMPKGRWRGATAHVVILTGIVPWSDLEMYFPTPRARQQQTHVYLSRARQDEETIANWPLSAAAGRPFRTRHPEGRRELMHVVRLRHRGAIGCEKIILHPAGACDADAVCRQREQSVLSEPCLLDRSSPTPQVCVAPNSRRKPTAGS